MVLPAMYPSRNFEHWDLCHPFFAKWEMALCFRRNQATPTKENMEICLNVFWVLSKPSTSQHEKTHSLFGEVPYSDIHVRRVKKSFLKQLHKLNR